MRILLIITLLCCLLWAATQLLEQNPVTTPPVASQGLPWQVEKLDNGDVRVFNLRPGVDTLQQAQETLGEDYQFGIIAKEGEPGSLELFYNRIQTGHLTGKLVLVADIPASELQVLRSQADKREVLSNGSSLYSFGQEKAAPLWQKPIKLMHYVPTVRLQEEMVLNLFGEPQAPARQVGETLTLYSYNDLGVSIFIDAKGKDYILYRHPNIGPQP